MLLGTEVYVTGLRCQLPRLVSWHATVHIVLIAVLRVYGQFRHCLCITLFILVYLA